MVEQTNKALSIVTMGVSGAGKSTIGKAIAGRLDYVFFDADDLHSAENVALMSSGHALDDAHRLPWLRAVGQRLEQDTLTSNGAVTACSALRRTYRDVLRSYCPRAFFVWLDGSESLIKDRVLHRHHEFMTATLLSSQFSTLEGLDVDEWGVRVDVAHGPEEVVELVIAALAS
jgi:gluconokinase